MKVQFIFRRDIQNHGHDYMLQHLYCGFKYLLGEENVGESPVNPFCHLPEFMYGSRLVDPAARDECGLDSDQAFPLVEVGGPFDLIIGGAHAREETIEASRDPNVKVAWIDGSDTSAQNLGPGCNFKRELPIGATWAHTLPLTYPTNRIPKNLEMERHGVVYYATTHGGTASDRMRIADDLSKIPGARVQMTGAQHSRPTPEMLHKELWSALVGIHWNPVNPLKDIDSTKSGWDANRIWENLAFGVAVVALRPFIEIPYPFTDGENIVYVDSADQVAVKVHELLDDPERARRIGKAGHEHFLKYHCAEARARYIIEKCGLNTLCN